MSKIRGHRAKCPGKTKSHVDVTDVPVETVAVGRPKAVWLVAPAAAAQHSQITIPVEPGTAIQWRTIVTAVPAILSPLPGVTRQVVQTKAVR